LQTMVPAMALGQAIRGLGMVDSKFSDMRPRSQRPDRISIRGLLH
jgi:hypothetical protein